VGSRVLAFAALSGSKEEMHGKFVNTCRVDEESDYVLSAKGGEVQERLWVSDLPLLEGDAAF